MPRTLVIPLPDHAHIWAKVHKGDFTDGYAVDSQLSPREAMEVALDMPRWAAALLKLRNQIVRPFGLQTGGADEERDLIFPITHETDNEIVVGIDDRHLNFRISIIRDRGKIHMGSWVHRNNMFGRVYLAIVMPFHVLIMRDAMRQIRKASIASSTAVQ